MESYSHPFLFFFNHGQRGSMQLVFYFFAKANLASQSYMHTLFSISVPTPSA